MNVIYFQYYLMDERCIYYFCKVYNIYMLINLLYITHLIVRGNVGNVKLIHTLCTLVPCNSKKKIITQTAYLIFLNHNNINTF